MQITDIQTEVYTILQENEGKFLDAYEIYSQLKARFPDVAAQMEAEYAERSYTPSALVANSLSHFARKDHHILQQGEQRDGQWAWQA